MINIKEMENQLKPELIKEFCLFPDVTVIVTYPGTEFDIFRASWQP